VLFAPCSICCSLHPLSPGPVHRLCSSIECSSENACGACAREATSSRCTSVMADESPLSYDRTTRQRADQALCSHMFVRKDEPSVHCRVEVGTCSSSWPCTDAHAPRRWITSGFLSSSVSISPPALRLSCACNRSHMHIAPCIGETGRPYHVHDWNRAMESAWKLQKKGRGPSSESFPQCSA